MPTSSGVRASANLLLAALPPGEGESLERELEHGPLAFNQVLQKVNESVSHIWFPASGIASMFARMSDGGGIEVAKTGREGMVGLRSRPMKTDLPSRNLAPARLPTGKG